MKARFDELLPFYVNGTLKAEERAEVEAWLRDHPKAEAELRWYESLSAKLKEDVPAVSSEVGLERALHRIRTEGPVPQAARRAATPSLFERARGWLASLVPQNALRPALAGALAVVAVQVAVIGGLVGQRDDSSEIRALKAAVTEHGPYLKVNFKADAREADIRLLLVEVRGSLAGGPGQLGDYYLRVPESRFDESERKLKQSSIVEQVAVVDALPARQ
jgi:anti-sigma-K factor RskA